MDLSPPQSNESLACLAELAASAEALSRLARQLADWEGPVRGGAQPLERRLVIVEQMATAMRALAQHGSRFRRMQARALYAEGLTMAQLAAVFGVSRQRVSTLLNDGRHGGAMEAAAEQAHGAPEPAVRARGGSD